MTDGSGAGPRAAAWLAAALACAAAPAARAEDDLVAVKAKRIVTVSGPVVEDGVVLVRGGRIEAVGRMEIPPLARVLDAGDGWVCPGFVEAHTQAGLDRANEQQPVVPFVSALDALDPGGNAMQDALADGVTTLLVIPGNDTQVGGQGIVVKPFGRSVEEMLLRRAAGLKLSLEPRRDTTRAAQLAAVRAALRDARETMDKAGRRRAEGASTPGEPPDLDDARREAMVDLLRGRLPAVIYAGRAQDVPNAFALLDEFSLEGFLVLGPDCWRAADLLRARQDAAEKKRPGAVLYVLDPVMEVMDRDEDEEDGEILRETAGILHRAGVRFALTSDGGPYPSRHLWFQAATAVRQGVPRDEALRAVTLHAARVLGVAERAGTIEPGRDGNLLLLTGDPLSAATWVDRVLIEGRVVYERSKDARLRRLVQGERRETVPAEEPR